MTARAVAIFSMAVPTTLANRRHAAELMMLMAGEESSPVSTAQVLSQRAIVVASTIEIVVVTNLIKRHMGPQCTLQKGMKFSGKL